MYSRKEFEKKQVVFVLAKDMEKISFANDNLVVKNKENKTILKTSCYNIFIVFVVGNISLTSGIIQRCKRFGFTICLMTTTMKVYHVINGRGEGNFLLRRKQYEYTGNEIGKHIIYNKILNQCQLLQSFRNKEYTVQKAISVLQECCKKVSLADNDFELMGIEGNAARAYFPCVFNVEEWKGRKPRVKADWINTLLDIGYNILFNYLEGLVTAFGFDIYQGVLHKNFYNRKSLICDFMEPFRTVIDSSIKTAISKHQFKQEDFIVKNHQYVLSWDKTASYVNVFATAIIEHREDIFLYVQHYYRAFMREKDIMEYPVFIMGEGTVSGNSKL